jgi:hypothetical protein
MKNNHADLASSARNSVENNGEIYAIFSTLKDSEFSLQLPLLFSINNYIILPFLPPSCLREMLTQDANQFFDYLIPMISFAARAHLPVVSRAQN